MEKKVEKNDLKKLLKEHLTIDVKETEDLYQRDVEIILRFDEEEICSATYNIERKDF